MKSLKNTQDVFDFVTNHLLKQNKRAGIAGHCLYRDNNLKCAVGCLISAKYYDPYFEGHGLTYSLIIKAVKLSHPKLKFTKKTRLVLTKLQDIHEFTSSTAARHFRGTRSRCALQFPGRALARAAWRRQ